MLLATGTLHIPETFVPQVIAQATLLKSIISHPRLNAFVIRTEQSQSSDQPCLPLWLQVAGRRLQVRRCAGHRNDSIVQGQQD